MNLQIGNDCENEKDRCTYLSFFAMYGDESVLFFYLVSAILNM